MAVDDAVSLDQIGHTLADVLAADQTARHLWVSYRGGIFELWLVTEPFEGLDPMRRLHGVTAALYEQFPSTPLRLHVLNPRNYPDADPSSLIPRGAQEIPLRPE